MSTGKPICFMCRGELGNGHFYVTISGRTRCSGPNPFPPGSPCRVIYVGGDAAVLPLGTA